ncbi:MAG: AAA family ATPase [Candidatus Sericytochromatia bacterium]
MLIAFHVENFRSFKERASLHLTPAALTELPGNVHRVETEGKALELLKSCVIYGHNASGKSNLIKALMYMKSFIAHSSEKNSLQINDVEPFGLDPHSQKNPSLFEIEFVLKGVRYTYGFRLNQTQVLEEWLERCGKRNTLLFQRQGQKLLSVVKKSFPDAELLIQKTRPNSLFLITADFLNNPLASDILHYMARLMVAPNTQDESLNHFTWEHWLENTQKRKELLELLKIADFGIHDLVIQEKPLSSVVQLDAKKISELPVEYHGWNAQAVEQGIMHSLVFSHARYQNGQEHGFADFGFHQESKGTQQFFNLAGPILTCLQNGLTMIVDELDIRLHAHLLRHLIELFHASDTGAQLIFTTHNTTLLDHVFRRDQIWFTEKNRYGASELYSLAEFSENGHKVRKDAAFQKQYLEGRYGATPYLSSPDYLLQMLKESHGQKN